MATNLTPQYHEAEEEYKKAQTPEEKLAGLKKLRKLDLYQTGITDAGLDALADLPELREVGLTGSKVTEEGYLRFIKARQMKGDP